LNRCGLIIGLWLRIADRLGQHLMQLSLGRSGRICHLATIYLSTPLLWPSAQTSIVRNSFGRPHAQPHLRVMLSGYRRAEIASRRLVALSPSFGRSKISSNSSGRDKDIAASLLRDKNRQLSLPIRTNGLILREPVSDIARLQKSKRQWIRQRVLLPFPPVPNRRSRVYLFVQTGRIARPSV
jgi:hypothetical protein